MRLIKLSVALAVALGSTTAFADSNKKQEIMVEEATAILTEGDVETTAATVDPTPDASVIDLRQILAQATGTDLSATERAILSDALFVGDIAAQVDAAAAEAAK